MDWFLSNISNQNAMPRQGNTEYLLNCICSKSSEKTSITSSLPALWFHFYLIIHSNLRLLFKYLLESILIWNWVLGTKFCPLNSLKEKSMPNGSRFISIIQFAAWWSKSCLKHLDHIKVYWLDLELLMELTACRRIECWMR